MLKMQKQLLKGIKSIFSDVRSAMISLVVTSLFVGGVWYLDAKTALHWLKNIMQSPTPLWATIALVLLLALYIYIKFLKKSSQSPINDPFEDYYFHPRAMACIHKKHLEQRVCEKCKINGVFSRIALTKDQDYFICLNCGLETPNIPEIQIATPKDVHLVVPFDNTNPKQEFTFKVK